MAPDRFAREHWGRALLLSRAADLPGGFTDLLDLDAVDELLSRRGLRTPFLRLARDGQLVPPSRFTGPGGTGAGVADQVLDDRVTELFCEGTTLVLQGLHRTWPPLAEFAAGLRAELGHPVQVNAYVTPPQSRGFAAHYDVHDVFVLQVAGAKHWRVHAPVHPDPLPGQPWTDHREAVQAGAERQPLLDTELEPGDALYLPRGHLHSANAQTDRTVHLTVGVPPVTRYAVAGALLRVAAAAPRLRGSLPLGVDVTDPSSLAGSLADTVAALRELLDHVDPQAVAAELTGPALAAGRPGPVGPLRQAAAAADVRPDRRVRRRPHLRWVVRTAPDGGPRLQLADRSVDLPAGTEPALHRLLDGRPVAVADLPGLDPPAQADLVRRLLQAAVVVPVDTAPDVPAR